MNKFGLTVLGCDLHIARGFKKTRLLLPYRISLFLSISLHNYWVAGELMSCPLCDLGVGSAEELSLHYLQIHILPLKAQAIIHCP